MDNSFLFLVFLIFIALAFDFLNGFHDSANSISTVVSTRVLPPKYAVIWAAFFNFVASFLIGTPVARTIGIGIISPGIIEDYVILAALGGAIIWNVITWYFGLPSSSSHALIGGLIGAGLVKSGIKVLMWSGIIKTTLFIFLSPAIGMLLGFGLMKLVLYLSQYMHVASIQGLFRKLQLLSAAAHSTSHGMNDAQKTMGIIAILLFSRGYLGTDFYVPAWVKFACYLVIALGTMAGGWRIVKTMGTKITKLRPMSGFCAESSAAISIFTASIFGIPVSTTHTITGAIVGVGATRRWTAVRWGVAGNIVWAWILTIPLAALISGLIYALIKVFLK